MARAIAHAATTTRPETIHPAANLRGRRSRTNPRSKRSHDHRVEVHEPARHSRDLPTELRQLFQQSDRLRLHLRLRAAQLVRRLLAERILQRQPGQSRPAQPLPALHHAGVHSGDHDEHLGRRAAARDRRTAADHSRRPISTRAGQVPGRRGHLQRLAGVLAGLELPRAAVAAASPTSGCSWAPTSATGSWGWRCWPSAWWPRS